MYLVVQEYGGNKDIVLYCIIPNIMIIYFGFLIFNNTLYPAVYTYYSVNTFLKVILYSYLILKKMNERIIDS